MTDKQIKKLNELTEMSQELGLYEDRPDWRITLQADHIKRLEEELQAKEQECEELRSLLKVRIEDLCDSCGASSMMPMPCKVYEKTLAEIKEIANRLEQTKIPFAAIAEQIKDKIEEVENE